MPIFPAGSGLARRGGITPSLAIAPAVQQGRIARCCAAAHRGRWATPMEAAFVV